MTTMIDNDDDDNNNDLLWQEYLITMKSHWLMIDDDWTSVVIIKWRLDIAWIHDSRFMMLIIVVMIELWW